MHFPCQPSGPTHTVNSQTHTTMRCIAATRAATCLVRVMRACRRSLNDSSLSLVCAQACFGGVNKSRFLSDTWIFDVQSERWTELRTDKCPRARRGAAAVAIGGEMWMYGGVGVGGDVCGDLWVLRGGSTWVEVEVSGGPDVPRPLPVSDHQIARWGRDILLVGGKTASSKDVGQPLWRFDTAMRMWEVCCAHMCKPTQG